MAQKDDTTARRVLGAAAPVGAAAFTATWAVLGAVSDGYTMWDITVSPYSWMAQPVSGLGLGETAPYMNSAFVACGALISTGTWVAMSSWPTIRTSRLLRWARPLVAATGLGMVICGFFDLESILAHTAGFLLAAGVSSVGLVLAGLGLRRAGRAVPDSKVGADRVLRAELTVAGALGLIGTTVFLVTFNAADAGANTGSAGLVQRALITVLMIAMGAIGLSTDARATDLTVVAAVGITDGVTAAGTSQPPVLGGDAQR